MGGFVDEFRKIIGDFFQDAFHRKAK